MKTKTLYRPVGEKEMILIAENNFKIYPPRLYWQPIFYPVLNEDYAIDIASMWNTEDEFGNYLGFVTSFNLNTDIFNKYQIQNVGAIYHDELWVPSEELNDFNEGIIGNIEILKIYIGKQFIETKSQYILDLFETTEIIRNEN